MSLNRRKFLKGAILLPVISTGSSSIFAFPGLFFEKSNKFKRVRPGDALWPSPEKWKQLNTAVNGNLVKIESPFAACKTSAGNAACNDLFKSLKNPYYIGDNPALTQTSGWLDAWTSTPSVYAVPAKKTSDVVAAVNFARKNNLRLVIKGGGHSYQGTSNSVDSLLIWTRAMSNIVIHDAFVGKGCSGIQDAEPAVSVGAGAIWMHVYDAVTTKGGWYVQGGGCATVGVAGLIQSGGFGSLSKSYGLAAAGLLEAEVVTADGSVLIANACTNPDLFWGLKGGGGGSLGVVTRLTLRLRKLPDHAGVVFGKIKAKSEQAFLKLITHLISFYKDQLFNSNWGEQIRFAPDNTVNISMMFQGLDEQQAYGVWQSLINWVSERPEDFIWDMPLTIHVVPAQRLWDVAFFEKNAPQLIVFDDRSGAPKNNIFWIGDQGEAGQFLYAYRSAWLPAVLLSNGQSELAEALMGASRFSTISLHFNKGLAGAPVADIAAAKDTAMNPAVLEAFALVIIAGASQPALPDIPGHQPDLKTGHKEADNINKAMDELLKIVPTAGSYVSESDFFQKEWQKSFWGANYPKLAAVKKKYDPEGLFFVHHGVGSEEWSDDGFTKIH